MIRTLVLYSNAVPSVKNTLAETFWREIIRVSAKREPPDWLKKLGLPGHAIFRSLNTAHDYRSLGYVDDWKVTFAARADLDCTFANVTNLVELWRARAAIKSADFIVVLHSALGDDTKNIEMLSSLLKDRSGVLAAFVGNEYVDLRRKRWFLRAVEANYVCSQLPISAANFVYEDLGRTSIIDLPHALNPLRFNNDRGQDKTMQFYFRGAEYPAWIGDSDRNRFIEKMRRKLKTANMPCDIEYGNINADEWARGLTGSRGAIGSEAGTYFLDKNNEIIETLKEIETFENDFNFEKFVSGLEVDYVNGKAISSRHFEAIGCGAVQLLLEGNYNDLLVEDVHYLSVKHDYSNLDEKLEEFSDDDRRQELADCALDHVLDKHTYYHRIEKLLHRAGLS